MRPFAPARATVAAAAVTGAAFAAVLAVSSSLSTATITAGIVALLIGSYLLRRYARARLLYERDDVRTSQADTRREPSVEPPSRETESTP